MEFNVIVVGAGSAGCTLASYLAKKGHKVALIDRKARDKIGRKTCGDAVSKAHFEQVEKEIGFGIPSGDEMKQKIIGMNVYPPNRKSILSMTSEDQRGFIINRHMFGQRLLCNAEDNGAKLYSETAFKDFIIKENVLTGVKCRCNSELIDFYAPLIIDATGASAILRNRIPSQLLGQIERKILDIDMGFAYREILKIKTDLENSDYIRLYFVPSLCKGGYAWVFPHGKQTINVGLGGSLYLVRDAKNKFQDFLRNDSLFEDSEKLHTGAGKVPVRRPLNSMVANNFAVVGDSASQVNPLHGGGIGPGMESAIYLGQVIEKAIELNNYSEAQLWDYNVIIHRKIGIRYAPLDIFRLCTTNISDRAFNIVLNKEIISQDELWVAGMEGELKMSFGRKLSKLWKGRSILGTIFLLNAMSKKMSLVKNISLNYPKSPNELSSWVKMMDEAYSELKDKFIKKKANI